MAGRGLLLAFAAVSCARAFATPRSPLLKNSGRALGTRGGTTAAALTDYSSVVSGLFGNMRVPAALISGGLVPLGFLGNPKKDPDDSPSDRFLKRAYLLVAMLSLSAELLVIIYTTVSINKLAETASAPAESLLAFIRRDHELAWTGANVNFIAGLLGFVTLLGLQTWFAFGHRFGRVGLSLAAAVFAHACSIVNRGIATGDGAGSRLANNYVGLALRYVKLLVLDVARRGGVLEFASLLCLGAAVWFTTQDAFRA